MSDELKNPIHQLDEPVFKTLTVQEVSEVLDFSSQYGAEHSRSYTVHNVVGKSTIYPSYGDFTQTLVFRTYGKWWNQCPSNPSCFKKYTNVSFCSQDFVDIQYNNAVYPTEIEIYETYNPGAVVRILACNDNNTEITDVYNRWFLLWSGSAQKCRHKKRVFSPKLKKCPFKTRMSLRWLDKVADYRRLRLEFNQDHCDYYTEIDAVYLHGLDSREEYGCDDIQNSLGNLSGQFEKQITMKNARHETENWNILLLPIEVINKILTYLTFSDFGNLSRTCRSFRDYCYDPLWFKEFDLQPYWKKMNKFSLQYLSERCRSTERLRLSWCGSNDMLSSLDFSRFLQNFNGKLRCLYLSCCRFVDQNALVLITKICPRLEELDLSSCIDIPSAAFDELPKLTLLKRLNLYRTKITEKNFENIARSCTGLMHLNLGGCFQLTTFDEAMGYLKYCPKIVSLDLWRAKSLTANGILNIFQNCPNLEEIDLGWCTNVATHGCLRLLVAHCPKIKKLFLTALRTVSDDDLIAIFKNCTYLQQLDILGNSNISRKCAEMVLMECKHLKFFDVSFCSDLDEEWYSRVKERYPDVNIKKSFQYNEFS